MNIKKFTLSAAVLAALVSNTAQAQVLRFDWSGTFTMLSPNGSFVQNPDANDDEFAAYYAGEPYNYYYGNRTSISGTMVFDTTTGAGSATIAAFDFFEGGLASPHDITMQAIGNGFGETGSLILTSMLFDWNAATPIYINLVMDGAGIFAALPSLMSNGVGGTVDQSSCSAIGSGCVAAASDGVADTAGAGSVKNPAYFPMGAIPMATTTYNVNSAGTDIGGSSIYGEPTVIYEANDSIGGSPMDNGPFLGFSANFDMTSVTLLPTIECSTCPPPVPIPASIWLFGSGLIALSGFSRRRVNKLKDETA